MPKESHARHPSAPAWALVAQMKAVRDDLAALTAELKGLRELMVAARDEAKASREFVEECHGVGNSMCACGHPAHVGPCLHEFDNPKVRCGCAIWSNRTH